MNNTPDSPAKPPDDRMDQGGNYWTLFTPGTWKVLHAVLQPVPDALEVGPVYGLAILSERPEADRLALFILSEKGQAILAEGGLLPLVQNREARTR